MNVRTIDFCN